MIHDGVSYDPFQGQGLRDLKVAKTYISAAAMHVIKTNGEL